MAHFRAIAPSSLRAYSATQQPPQEWLHLPTYLNALSLKIEELAQAGYDEPHSRSHASRRSTEDSH